MANVQPPAAPQQAPAGAPALAPAPLTNGLRGIMPDKFDGVTGLENARRL